MSTSVNPNNENNLQDLNSSSSTTAIFNSVFALGVVLGDALQSKGIESMLEAQMSDTILQNDIANAQNIDHEVEKQSKHHFWHKIIKGTLDAVLLTVAVTQFADGNVAGGLLAAFALMHSLSPNGMELGKVTNGAADLLHKAGVPEDYAHAIVDVLVVVAAAAAGDELGGAFEDAAAVGEDAKKDEKTAEEGEKAAKKGLSKATSTAIMSGSIATSELAPNFANSLTEIMNLSGEAQKIVEGVLTLILEVASVGTGIYSLYSAASDSSNFAKGAKVGLQLARGSLLAGDGVVDIQSGVTAKNLGDAGAILTQNNALNNINNSMMQQTEDETKQVINSLGDMLRNLDYFGGLQAEVAASQ